MNTEGGEEGESKMYGKSNMEMYNTMCKTDGQWEFAVWLRELKQGLYDNLEGWDGEGDGREVCGGGDKGVSMADSFDVWQKTTKFCKAIICQLKKINKVAKNKVCKMIYI